MKDVVNREYPESAGRVMDSTCIALSTREGSGVFGVTGIAAGEVCTKYKNANKNYKI